MAQLLQRRPRGFTIVELIVVVAVIGILVAISVVAYNGIQERARDNSVLSDAEGVSGELTRAGINNNGTYTPAMQWYSPGGTNDSISFTPSSGNIVDVVTSTNEYCIRIYNPDSLKYKTLATAALKESTEGICTTLIASLPAYADAGMTPPVIPLPTNQGIVTTLAGSGVSGFTDGTGGTAQFNYPVDVAVDPPSGNIYVLEANNNRIRQVTTTGVVTTLAGTVGQFSSAWGMAVNNSGTMFVADTYNTLVKTVTPSGTVSVFAGASWGCANGTGIAAEFSRVIDVAADTAGNIYVADMDSQTIRKITPTGVVTTLAGTCNDSGSADGTGSAARFNTPYGIAVDGSGNVYVADRWNHKIRKITPSGVVTTLAGSGVAGFNDGSGTAAQFSGPSSVTVNVDGIVYVSDDGNSRVRQISPAGVVTTLAGSATNGSNNGTGSAAQFSSNMGGIAVDAAGTVYIADTGNNLIRQMQ